MNEPTIQLDQLRNKVEKLINLHKDLHVRNAELLKQQERLKDEVKQCRQQIEELENHNKVMQVAQAVSGADQNTRDIKLKINEYIREIDKCLALINR